MTCEALSGLSCVSLSSTCRPKNRICVLYFYKPAGEFDQLGEYR
jgi:hypothetical protein